MVLNRKSPRKRSHKLPCFCAGQVSKQGLGWQRDTTSCLARLTLPKNLMFDLLKVGRRIYVEQDSSIITRQQFGDDIVAIKQRARATIAA